MVLIEDAHPYIKMFEGHPYPFWSVAVQEAGLPQTIPLVISPTKDYLTKPTTAFLSPLAAMSAISDAILARWRLIIIIPGSGPPSRSARTASVYISLPRYLKGLCCVGTAGSFHKESARKRGIGKFEPLLSDVIASLNGGMENIGDMMSKNIRSFETLTDETARTSVGSNSTFESETDSEDQRIQETFRAK
ncbi:hypothetical protein BC829DRAFT_458834 [Chytridium lagenaria]|nr:hypothetical protein BC829DRAFT_458834 [Chytridium lagenaria]